MSGQNRFVADLFKDLLSVSSVKFLVTRALGFEGFFFLLHSFINNPTYLFTSPFVNDRMADFSFNFWVRGWNVAIWPFKWNLFSGTFGWCYLHLSILQKKKKKLEIWPYFDNWATSRIEKVLCLSHAWAYHGSNVLPNKERSFSISSYFV